MAHSASKREIAFAKLLASPPSVVVTASAEAFDYLNELAATTDFVKVDDPHAEWAARVKNSSSAAFGIAEGSVFPSTGGTAATWIASPAAVRRLRAYRF